MVDNPPVKTKTTDNHPVSSNSNSNWGVLCRPKTPITMLDSKCLRHSSTTKLSIIRIKLLSWPSKDLSTSKELLVCTNRRMPNFGTWLPRSLAFLECGPMSASWSTSSCLASVLWSVHVWVILKSIARPNSRLDSSRCLLPSISSAGSGPSTGVGWCLNVASKIRNRCNNSSIKPMLAPKAIPLALRDDQFTCLFSKQLIKCLKQRKINPIYYLYTNINYLLFNIKWS